MKSTYYLDIEFDDGIEDGEKVSNHPVQLLQAAVCDVNGECRVWNIKPKFPITNKIKTLLNIDDNGFTDGAVTLDQFIREFSPYAEESLISYGSKDGEVLTAVGVRCIVSDARELVSKLRLQCGSNSFMGVGQKTRLSLATVAKLLSVGVDTGEIHSAAYDAKLLRKVYPLLRVHTSFVQEDCSTERCVCYFDTLSKIIAAQAFPQYNFGKCEQASAINWDYNVLYINPNALPEIRCTVTPYDYFRDIRGTRLSRVTTSLSWNGQVYNGQVRTEDGRFAVQINVNNIVKAIDEFLYKFIIYKDSKELREAVIRYYEKQPHIILKE